MTVSVTATSARVRFARIRASVNRLPLSAVAAAFAATWTAVAAELVFFL